MTIARKNWHSRWFNIGKARVGFIAIRPPAFSFTIELNWHHDAYKRVVWELALCILSFAIMVEWMPNRYNRNRITEVW